jgi:hypothetical protein
VYSRIRALESALKVRIAKTPLDVFGNGGADHIGYSTLLNARNRFQRISLLG